MPPTVLLIDDDEAFVYLLRRYAEQSGYALDHAPGVQAARGALAQRRPALVLFNLLLAAADERVGLAELQAELAGYDIPIVGFSDTVVAVGDLAFEIDYYLAQPLLYADFCAACASVGVEPQADGLRDL